MIKSLTKSLKTKKNRIRKAKRERSRRGLRLENLEARQLMAVDAFVVDTAVDENDGVGVGTGTSLREAINFANANLLDRFMA